MQRPLPKVQLSKLYQRLISVRTLVPGGEEMYHNDLERRYKRKQLPPWMKSNG